MAFLIYTQIDKIMINYFLGEKDVGIYTIGVQLSGILGILLGPVQNSIFPKMLELYKVNYKKYYDFYMFSNIIVTQGYMLLILISVFVVKYSFGYVYAEEYLPAIEIYCILTISILIKANALFQMNHMVIKNIVNKSFYKTLTGLVMNVSLNYVLIPKYGINGAAFSTSITHFFTAFCMDFFIKEYREQAFVQLKSFNVFYWFFRRKKN